MSNRRVVGVRELVSTLKSIFDRSEPMHGVVVEGEVSNLRKPSSNHWYFSLKEENSAISCVMFAWQNRNVKFPVNNGDKVIVTGDVTVYPVTGAMQIQVSSMRQSGIGELYLKLEELKKKLSAEGLFSPEHKKSLPLYPMNIALVTGNNTAAREDVMITFAKRWPCASITEYHTPVQGTEAPEKIKEALRKADEGNHDVILLVRGGGSLEDLWCFNDESLARVVYDMKTPIVTGIGHEIDTTLCDYVSDCRANTPTGAVEAATPDIYDVTSQLKQYGRRIQTAAENRCAYDRHVLDSLRDKPFFHQPERLIREQILRLDTLSEKLMKTTNIVDGKRIRYEQTKAALNQAMQTKVTDLRKILHDGEIRMQDAVRSEIYEQTTLLKEKTLRLQTATERIQEERRNELEKNMRLLDAYSPLKILDRGYSVVTKDHIPVTDVHDLKTNDRINVRFAKGIAEATVLTCIEKKGDS